MNYFLLVFIVGFIGLWILFINVMTWKKNANKIPKWLTYPLYVIVAIAYIWDVVFNIIFGTIMFLDIPQELTLTGRMRRIIITKEDWRLDFAIFICKKLVEPWDPKHCGL